MEQRPKGDLEMSAAENKAHFLRFIAEGPNKGNLAVVDEMVDENVAYYIPGIIEPMRGREGVKGVVSAFRIAFPDLHVTIEEVIAEGDTVAARVTARGTNTGELMGTAPSGKRAEWAVNHYSHFKDGKLVEDRVNFDQLAFLQQLNMIPTAP
jgi:predicted ester cyclase